MDNIKLIAFDLDGVLIHGAPEMHYNALNRALGLFGFSIGENDHLRVYNGLPTKQKLIMMSEAGMLPSSLHDIISEKKKQYTSVEIQKSCHPSHDKLILLEKLRQRGYKIVCCSNATKASVVFMLQCAGIHEYFDDIIGNDEGMKPKPAPDIYLEAFRRFQVDPSEAIIVEDAEHGYQAALASGGHVIRVKDATEVNSKLFITHNLL